LIPSVKIVTNDELASQMFEQQRWLEEAAARCNCTDSSSGSTDSGGSSTTSGDGGTSSGGGGGGGSGGSAGGGAGGERLYVVQRCSFLLIRCC